MNKILKRYLTALLLILQLIMSIAAPIAKGDDMTTGGGGSIGTSSSTGTPNAANSNGTSNGKNNGTGVPAVNSTKFQVSKYLTAPGQDQSYLKNDNPIGSFIIQIINFLVLTIGSLCFLSIVIGGFILLISNGNENLVNKGKEIIKYAIIGLVIVLVSYLLVAFVQSLFYELPGK